MKMIVIELTRRGFGWDGWTSLSGVSLCSYAMKSLFDIPEHIQSIEVVLRDKATDQSYPCEYVRDLELILTGTNGVLTEYQTMYETDDFLNKLIDKGEIGYTFHVSLRY